MCRKALLKGDGKQGGPEEVVPSGGKLLQAEGAAATPRGWNMPDERGTSICGKTGARTKLRNRRVEAYQAGIECKWALKTWEGPGGSKKRSKGL